MHRITGFGNFSKMLDKATSNLLLETDWETTLSICDLIRQGDVQPKHAIQAIHKKITNDNPHTALYALMVLECCVKNCGALVHDEVCTKQYMEQLKEAAKTTSQEEVKAKILELIQAWAYAFRESPKYRAVQDTLRIMKAENFDFPVLKESDAMFDASLAPQWMDGETCHRCRTTFTTFNRKHHCRACGQVFCNQCSSKQSTLPKFGIEKEVRVCNTCYDAINKPPVSITKETDLPAHYLASSLAQQQQVPQRKSEDELREEEELQIALALSQSEAEHKEQEKKRVTSAIISNSTSFLKETYSPVPSPEPSPMKEDEVEEVDPELAKYLNRPYWEQRQSVLDEQTSRQNVTSPSAPNISSPMPQKVAAKQQNSDIDNEMENFVKKLKSQVEIFVNRMKSNSSRGRSIANDTSVQNLFMNITAMHSELLRYIRNQEDKRVYYEGLQDKLTQIKDGRAALDALREEHREKLLREKQEADIKKQQQMAMKLEIMRKKKQEYFEYQRELALSKVQEEKRELQMRQEIQKQQYKLGLASAFPVSNYMGTMVNQGSPVRRPQCATDFNNAMSPTSQVYIYPHGAMNQYPGPTYNMMPHHHQHPQIIDPAMQVMQEQSPGDPSLKIPIQGHYNPEQHQESLGQVTISGPGVQMPSQMQGPQSSQIPGCNQNIVIVPREIVTPLSHDVHSNQINSQHSQNQQQHHLPQHQTLPQHSQIPQMMTQHQLPQHPQQTQIPQYPQNQAHAMQLPPQPQHMQSIPQMHSMGGMPGNIPEQALAGHQQMMMGQAPPASGMQRQLPQNSVLIQNQQMQARNLNHLGNNISIPTGQMSVPPQITNGTMGQNPQAQGMPEMGMIQGLQPQIHAMTMQQGQHMQYQAQPQQVQVVQVKSVPEEPEGRKSPEVAELISFD